MAKYRFYFERNIRGHIEVDADNIDDAYEKAYLMDGDIDESKDQWDYEFIGELKQ